MTRNFKLRRDKLALSGAFRDGPIYANSDRRNPSVLRSGKRKTARRVSAVSILKFNC
ncbi:MAG: hypothetical protein ACI835_005719, partial [Planctomycetota bacterium]